MKNFKLNAIKAISSLSMVMLLAACGGHSSTTDDTTGGTTANVVPQNPNPLPTFTPNPNPTPTNNPNTGPAPVPMQFSITGAGGAYPTWSSGNIATTDNILKVQVTAGAGSQIAIPGYSNFQTKYGCVSYSVTVLGQTLTTGILAVPGEDNYLCPNAPTSQVLDFYNALSHGSLNTVNVHVVGAMYDLYCQEFWAYYEQLYPVYGPYWYAYSPMGGNSSYYCTLHSVYKTHVINGSVAVQTDTSGSFQ